MVFIRASALAVLLLTSINAGATDFSVTRFDDPVPNGCVPGDCSLREAVMSANALSGADRIILAAGIYHLTIPGTFLDASIGDLDIDSAIEIVGAGAASTTILGENSARIFTISDGSSLLLHRLTVDHGRDSGGGGGAILQNDGELTIEDAVISGSQSNVDGGAIRNSGCYETVLRRVQLLNNAADRDGGAIHAGCGGVLLIDSVVSGNYAAVGGGAIEGYYLRVYRSLIEGNQAVDGGGINGKAYLEVHESTIAGNTAVKGGGIYAVHPFVIELSTLSANAASGAGGAGGAIYIDDEVPSGSAAKVLSSTLYLNTGPSGSVVHFNDSQATPIFSVTFQNTVVDGECTRSGAGVNAIDGLLGNLESPGNTCGFGGAFANGTFSTHDVPGANVKLGALGDNGGQTPTHLPLPGSAVIGTGWQAVCEKFDQRGYVRTGCDVGAVEAGAIDDVIFRTGNDY